MWKHSNDKSVNTPIETKEQLQNYLTVHGGDEYPQKWVYYCPCIVDIILDIQTKQQYAYNADVEKKASVLPLFEGLEHDILATLVYNSQTYVSQQKELKRHNELLEQGYTQLTPDTIASIADNGLYYDLIFKTETALGDFASTKTARLMKDAKDHYFWLRPRHTRTGTYVNFTEYFKLSTIKQKKPQTV